MELTVKSKDKLMSLRERDWGAKGHYTDKLCIFFLDHSGKKISEGEFSELFETFEDSYFKRFGDMEQVTRITMSLTFPKDSRYLHAIWVTE